MIRSIRLTAVLLALGFLMASPSTAQTFVAQPQFTGGLTYGMHLADLDGDTDLDLVYMGLDGPNVVFKNNGSGVLTQHQAIPSTLAGSDAVAADFDRDGDLDLAFANGFYGDATLCSVRCDQNTIFLNGGTGTFPSIASWVDGEAGGTKEIAVADFNGDGRMDFVTANWQNGGGASSAVWINNPGPDSTFTGFTKLDLPGGPHSARAVAVGDFNGDATPDIVMSFGQLFLSTGPATWTFSNLGFTSTEVLAGNVDGVNRDDIVIPGNWEQHQVRLNNGAGSFTGLPAFGTSSPLFKARLVDVSGDGNLDLVAAADGGGTRVYVGDGSGGFTASTTASHGGNRDVVAGDLNGDGRIDFATSFNSTFGGEVWLNSGRNVFSVTNNADSGPGSLRQAILNANATPNLPLVDYIQFAITGPGPHVIEPTSPLPDISAPVWILGASQAGARCENTVLQPRDLRIVLDGTSAGSGNGLTVGPGGHGSVIEGFNIREFPGYGVRVDGADDVHVRCNYLGTDITGTVAAGNTAGGVLVVNSTGSLVGGNGPNGAYANLVSGNGSIGVTAGAGAVDTRIEGNDIGLNIGRTAAIANLGGVDIDGATSTTVWQNFIGGNTQAGIQIFGDATSTAIEGNQIGNLPGLAPLPNAIGVDVVAADLTTIGTGLSNIIAHNQDEGILFRSGGGTIQGNTLVSNGSGIVVDGTGSGLSITNNAVSGSNSDGLAIRAGVSHGIEGNTLSGNGGAGIHVTAVCPGGPGTCNVSTISDNAIFGNTGAGILLTDGTSDNLIVSNKIGLDSANNVQANQDGIHLFNASRTTIGGSSPVDRNIISGNNGTQVVSLGSGADNVLYGNYIGLAENGTTAIPGGPVTVGAHDTGLIIGGPVAGQGNFIVSGGLFGIEISGSGHVIQGNHIGADVNGNDPAGAGQDRGINVGTATDVTIGGEGAGEGNLIAYNGGAAIRMNDNDDDNPAPQLFALRTRIVGNEIRNNGGRGIDIGEYLVPIVQDPGDLDIGGNNRQNYPDVTLAHIDAGGSNGLLVEFTQNSANGGGAGASTYPIRVHAYAADGSGRAGQRLLGWVDLAAADAESPQVVNFGDADLLGVSLGSTLVFTATDALGNTSEFSPVAPVVDPLEVTNTNDSGSGSLRSAMLYANNNPGPDTIVFTIPGPGPHAIQLLSSLPTITQAVTIDGYTQPGASPNTAAGFAAGNAVLKIRIECATGCVAGTNAFRFAGHSGSAVRGIMTGDLTGTAVIFDATSEGNTVAGNYFGTDGAARLGNGSIQVSGNDNVVGGALPADRNVIVGGGVGQNPSALRTIIRGNFFGTNAAGTAKVGSGAGAANIAISSNQARETVVRDNLIANANWYAIESTMANDSFGDANWTIEGNRIGTDVTGIANLGSGAGVFIQKGANGSVIRSNVIANNPGFGVRVAGGDGEYSPKFIAIRGNSFYDNGQNGIVLGGSAGTPIGLANEGIVAPTLVSAEVVGAGDLVIAVTADAGTIEFFEADGSGAEGRVLLGTPVIHLGGTASYPVGNAAALGVILGDNIVATRTDVSSNTSMFSANTQVVAGSVEIAHYRANGTLDDELGNHPAEWGNSTAGIAGSPIYLAGVDGDAFLFDGTGANSTTDASFVSVPTLDNTMLGGSSFTFAAWVKPTDCPSGECQIASTSKHNVDFGWELRLEGGNLRFTYKLVDGNQPGIGVGIPFGQWSHVAVSWDAATNTPRLYVDGVLVNNAPVAEAFAMLTDASGKLVIGENNDWLIPSQPWGPFAGSIDEVRVFDAVLSDLDVATIYAEFTPPADPLVVTNTGDSGAGTLRNAIAYANSKPGFDTISFAISGAGPHVIDVATPLPLIQDPVLIDGLSQAGATCGLDVSGHDLRVVLRGDLYSAPTPASGNGVHIFGNGSGSTIQGLVIQGFPGSGVAVEWAERVSIRCNFIGTTADGLAPYDNGEWAVVLRSGSGSGANRNVIGGPDASDANLLGSVRLGHVVSLNESAIVQNNRVGVSPDGAPLLSTEPGVTTYTGINLGDAASGSTISDNEIGGGFVNGIEFQGANGATVSGNRIGIGPGGEHWGNDVGIWLQKGSSDNTLGPDNMIAHNGIGIAIAKGDGTDFPVRNRITGNSIFGNTTAGIDLASGTYPDGVRNANDAGDGDTGANGLQNAPAGLSVDRQSSGAAMAMFTLDTPLTGGVTVELFTADASGQGQTLLGTLIVPDLGTSPGQTHVLAFDGSSLGLSDHVVATATSGTGSTSEFSLPGSIQASFEVPAGFVYGTAASTPAPPRAVAAGTNDEMLVVEGSTTVARYASDGTGRTVVLNALTDATSAVTWAGYDWVADQGSLRYKGTTQGTAPAPAGVSSLAVGPDGCLYVIASGGVHRACAAAPASLTFALFASSAESLGGLAWDSGDNLYVSLTGAGTLVKVPAGSTTPVSLAGIQSVATGLAGPRSLAFSEDDQIFVAASNGVLYGAVGGSLAPFADIPGASIAMGSLSRLLVANPGSGQVHRFVIPITQAADAPLRFYLTAEMRDMMPGVEAAVQGAFATWQGVSTADAAGRMEYGLISPYPPGEPSITDYRNEIHLGGLPLGPSTLAVASKLIKLGATPEESRIVTADIVFNERFAPGGDAQDKFVVGISTADHDIQGILTHELGHAALGLIHSLDPTAAMFFVLPKDARNLKVDDVAQASVLAPSGVGEGAFGTITGSVVSGNPATPGMRVAAAGVLATNLATNESLHAYTDRNGNFSMRFVPSGQYRLGVFALDGSVFSLKWPLTPGRVSRHLQTIANELDFLEEYWNGTNESANDLRTEVTEVTVGVGTVSSGIDFVTNLDTAPPRVVSVSPAADQTGVFVKPVVTVQFSEGVQLGSFSATMTCVSCGTSGAPLDLTLDKDLGRLAVAVPGLAPLATYELSVNGATDRQGNVQTVAFKSRFSTRDADVTAPSVVSVVPTTGDEPTTTQPVIVTFSEPMDGATLRAENFNVLAGGGPGIGTVVDGKVGAISSTVLSFEPASAWQQQTDYVVVLKPGLTDLAANPVSTVDLTYTFTTPDDLPPTVLGFGPLGGPYSGDTFAYVDYSEPVVLGTANPFSVNGGLPGSVELANGGKRVVFSPVTTLGAGPYSVVFNASMIQDLTGNQAASPGSWSFSVAGEAQALLALSPHTAAVGSLVTLDVAGFIPSPTDVVTFEGGATTLPVTVSGSSLTFEVPGGAQTGAVSVRNLAGPVFTVYVPDPYVEPAVRIATTDSGPRDVEASPDGTLAVAVNTASNSVSIVDRATGDAIAIPVGKSPLRVVITPDGTRAYVTNFESHSVSVIDLGTRTVVATIPVGYNPYGIDISPDGSLVYVAEYTSRSVSIIDAIPTSGTFNLAIRTIDTSSSTREAATNPDGGTTRLVEGGTREMAEAPDGANAKLASESNPRDVEANPDGTGIWIGTNFGILVVEVDLDKDQADWAVKILISEGTIRENSLSPDGGITRLASEGTVRDASGDPEGGTTIAAKESTVRDLESNPDGTFLFITTATGQLLVHAIPDDPYDSHAPYEAVTRLGSESNTRESAVSPDGTLVYATNYSTGTVSIHNFGAELAAAGADNVSGASYGLALLDIIKVGDRTEGIAYSAAGNFAMVANSGSAAVSFLTFDASPGSPDGISDPVTGTADDVPEDLPTEYALDVNYPNPFNPETTIGFALPESSEVRLEVFDVLGRRVRLLAEGPMNAGWHRVTFRADDLPSGVYLYRIQAGTFAKVRQMVLVK